MQAVLQCRTLRRMWMATLTIRLDPSREGPRPGCKKHRANQERDCPRSAPAPGRRRAPAGTPEEDLAVCRSARTVDRRGCVPHHFVRMFLDTNVLVSAFASRGLCAEVLELVLLDHDLIVGRNVLRDLRRRGAGRSSSPPFVRPKLSISSRARPPRSSTTPSPLV